MGTADRLPWTTKTLKISLISLKSGNCNLFSFFSHNSLLSDSGDWRSEVKKDSVVDGNRTVSRGEEGVTYSCRFFWGLLARLAVFSRRPRRVKATARQGQPCHQGSVSHRVVRHGSRTALKSFGDKVLRTKACLCTRVRHESSYAALTIHQIHMTGFKTTFRTITYLVTK